MRKFGIEQLGDRELMAANILAGISPFPGFTGGVRVAAGDINGDGTADVVDRTSASTGVGGHVRVFDAGGSQASGADGDSTIDPSLVDSLFEEIDFSF